ncbi:MAG: hypothetical protein ABIJ09_26270 [Pseudomonadota bacterium]
MNGTVLGLLVLVASLPREPLPVAENWPAWRLEVELPLAVSTTESASRARGEFDLHSGLRTGIALEPGAWVVACELGVLTGWPGRQGSAALSTRSQDLTFELGLRFGPMLRARGFELQPHLRVAGVAGLHMVLIEASGHHRLAARPLGGLAAGVGLRAGHGKWYLRWDFGVQGTTRTSSLLATVGLGFHW